MKLPFTHSPLKKDVSLPGGSLKYIQLVDIAFKNLFYKKLRTSLTIAGVFIGVGAVAFLLAFGFGLRDVVARQVVDSNSIRTVDVTPAKANLVQLNGENQQRIKDTSGVLSVAPVYFYAAKANYANAETEGVLYGGSQEFIRLSSFKRVAGELPNFENDPKALFVNAAYLKAIGTREPQQIIGKEVEVSTTLPPVNGAESPQELSFTAVVRGVVESGSGSELFVSDSIFQDAGVESASQLKVLVGDKADVPTVQKKVEALGFLSTSPLQTLEQINQIFGILNIVFLGFGGIGLLIATLGMFNTLTISLLERTKEIGLMVALGARHKDVKRLFIVEAVGLAILGGGLGVAGAYGLSTVVNMVLNQLAQRRGVVDSFNLFSFPWWLILSLLGFSVLLGLLVVFLPARRAARINPIEALKT